MNKFWLLIFVLCLWGWFCSCTPAHEGLASGRRPALAERRHQRDVHHFQAQFTPARPRHRH